MADAEIPVGREREWEEASRAVRDGRGVLLTGAAGIGKSYLADRLGDLFRDSGSCTVRLRATQGAADTSFGLLTMLLTKPVAGGSEGFSEVRERLLEHACGQPLLLVVDDVNYLDEASAALILHLVTFSGVRVVMTVRSVGDVPVEVSDLLGRGVVRRISLGHLSESACADISNTLAMQVVADSTHAVLYGMSGGNPLFLREVLAAFVESGSLTPSTAGLELARVPVDSPRLADLVAAKIGKLSPDAARVLRRVAFADGAGIAEIAGIDLSSADAARAVNDVVEAGLVRVEQHDRRLIVVVAHPVFGEVVRASTSIFQSRAVFADLALNLRGTGCRRRGDLVRFARLALDGGLQVDSALLARAARAAFRSCDFVTARRLAREAYQTSADFDSGLLLARTLCVEGDLVGFRAHARHWPGVHPSPAAHTAAASVTSLASFWLAQEGDATLHGLDEVIDAVRDSPIDLPDITVADLEALRGYYLGFSRRFPAAWRALEPLFDQPCGRAQLIAAFGGAFTLHGLGRPIEAMKLIDDTTTSIGGDAAAERIFPPRLNTRTMLLIDCGQLTAALQLADDIVRTSVDEIGVGFALAMSSLALVYQGSTARAIELALAADQHFIRPRGVGARRWTQTVLAFAQASHGLAQDAAATLARLAADRHPATLFNHLIARARAWQQVAAGYPEHARRILHDAAEECAGVGDVAGEVHCLHDCSRLGNARIVRDRVEKLGPQLEGDFYGAIVDRVRGSATGDHTLLAATAARFASMTANLLAAETFGEAANAAVRAGDPRSASHYERRKSDLMGLCDVTGSIVTTGLTTNVEVPLSRRELDVAALAATGLKASFIGERLFISTRTVESHLAKIYDKLGARSRDELAGALGL